MSTLWIDGSAGLAGDMLCGALLDAGADLAGLQRELDKLGLEGLSVRTRPVTRGAFACTKFDALVEEAAADGHDHGHQHGHDHSHDHAHTHRGWAEIRARIEAAGLAPRVQARAIAAFSLLARAEARVHGTSVDEVSFHEVGAADSIADMVGFCVLLEQLGVDELIATPLPMGGGHAMTQHGRISLPAPATLGVLAGWPMVQDGRTGELVTPTGAALVAALAQPGPLPSMRVKAQGWGAGTRNPPEVANAVRVVLGERVKTSSPTQVLVLEAQVDDLPGEAVPVLIDALLQAGALDATATPLLMKKGRPGLLLRALAVASTEQAVGAALLEHSSSFGLRRYAAERVVLERRHVTVETAFGPVRVKLGERGGQVLHASPEHVDCARAAAEHGVSLERVRAAALRALEVPGWP